MAEQFSILWVDLEYNNARVLQFKLVSNKLSIQIY